MGGGRQPGQVQQGGVGPASATHADSTILLTVISPAIFRFVSVASWSFTAQSLSAIRINHRSLKPTPALAEACQLHPDSFDPLHLGSSYPPYPGSSYSPHPVPLNPYQQTRAYPPLQIHPPTVTPHDNPIPQVLADWRKHNARHITNDIPSSATSLRNPSPIPSLI